jgi:hypothetical protein
MKRHLLVLTILILFLTIPSVLLAGQCWTFGDTGKLNAVVKLVGTVGSNKVYSLNGFSGKSISDNVLVEGTYIVPNSGNIRLTLHSIVARPDYNPVYREWTLNPKTLSGTGYYYIQNLNIRGQEAVKSVTCSSLMVEDGPEQHNLIVEGFDPQ